MKNVGEDSCGETVWGPDDSQTIDKEIEDEIKDIREDFRRGWTSRAPEIFEKVISRLEAAQKELEYRKTQYRTIIGHERSLNNVMGERTKKAEARVKELEAKNETLDINWTNEAKKREKAEARVKELEDCNKEYEEENVFQLDKILSLEADLRTLMEIMGWTLNHGDEINLINEPSTWKDVVRKALDALKEGK